MTSTTFIPRTASRRRSARFSSASGRAAFSSPAAAPISRGAVHVPQAKRSRPVTCRPRSARSPSLPGKATVTPTASRRGRYLRPQLLLAAALLLQRDLEDRGGRGRGGGGMQRRREAQLRAGRQPEGVADDARPHLRHRRHAVLGVAAKAAGASRRSRSKCRRPRPDPRPANGTRPRAAACPRCPRPPRGRGGREDEAQPVLARALRLRGQGHRVAVPRVVERETAHRPAIQQHLGRLSAHALVGGESTMAVAPPVVEDQRTSASPFAQRKGSPPDTAASR